MKNPLIVMVGCTHKGKEFIRYYFRDISKELEEKLLSLKKDFPNIIFIPHKKHESH